ncbi:tail subunit [Vibrio phage VpKK5]|uniref:minor tail protein n=1 Tax=Vibrio phage VpKK5 TaxID=1538804 RepID=UPI0004F838E7|nr:minor tail protein [Vibrio phage VpKK5]AIM40551.1 tail subunit [Vibrio phage VpKK5]
MANGSRHSLYAIEEAVYGQTPADPVFDTVRITGTTLGLSKDSLQSEEIRDDRQIADFRLGANQVGGDINFELSYGSFDNLLESAFQGEWANDTLQCGIERKSFTFLRYFADLLDTDPSASPYFIYTGCEINTMTLTVNANAMITGTFGVIGQSQEITGTDPATDINPPTTTSPLDSFTGELREGGTTIAVITELGLSLDNGLAARFVVGSKDSILPEVGRSNLTGTMTAYFESSALVEKFLNEDDSSIEFDLPDAEGNVQTWTIPRIKYTGGQPDVEGEGSVMLSMPFQALLDTTLGTNLQVVRAPAAPAE